MKREYFGMLFMAILVASFLLANYIFGYEIVREKISAFIVIWVLLGFFAGQYSMRFPKAF